MSDTPTFGLPEWAAAQATPWLTENETKRIIEAAARGIIEDNDLSAPPGSCADGACYLVAGTGTGAWAGHDGEMAIAVGTNAANGWYFVVVAVEGVRLYVRDENLTQFYNGASWYIPTAIADPTGGGVQDAEARTAINAIIVRLESLGQIPT